MGIIAKIKSERMGFVKESEIAAVVAENRMQQVIVRCGKCRFMCAAQYVAHLIAIIEADPEKRDYVRDVSFPEEQ